MSITKKAAGGAITIATVISLSGALSPHQHPRTDQTGANDLTVQAAGEEQREAENERAMRETAAQTRAGDAADAASGAGAADADDSLLKAVLDGR